MIAARRKIAAKIAARSHHELSGRPVTSNIPGVYAREGACTIVNN